MAARQAPDLGFWGRTNGEPEPRPVILKKGPAPKNYGDITVRVVTKLGSSRFTEKSGAWYGKGVRITDGVLESRLNHLKRALTEGFI